MASNCEECRRLVTEYLRATDELFHLNSRLTLAELADDQAEMKRLRRLAAKRVAERGALRELFVRHAASGHRASKSCVESNKILRANHIQ